MDCREGFGKALREAREATGMSQETFADVVGLDRTTISLIERGRQSPTVETLWRMSEHLQLSPSHLIERVQELVS